jgi:hypothetical protein
LRIVGHGIDVIPRLPVTVGWLEGDVLMIGEGLAGAAFLKPGRPTPGRLVRSVDARSTLLKLSTGPGATEVLLPRGQADPDRLFVEVRTSDRAGGWTIVTQDQELAWPRGFSLRVLEASDSRQRAYELFVDGAPECAIEVHGPFGEGDVPAALMGPPEDGERFVLSAGRGRTYVIFARGADEVIEAARQIELRTRLVTSVGNRAESESFQGA